MKTADQIADATRAYEVVLTLCKGAVALNRSDVSRAALVWFTARRQRMIQDCPEETGAAMTWMIDRIIDFRESRPESPLWS